MTDEAISLPTLSQIIELLPKVTSLFYIDYRDSLDNSLEQIQQCISDQSYLPIDEVLDSWTDSTAYESETYLLKELKDDLIRSYDLDDAEAEELINEHEDTLREILRDRDESTPLRDLLRNTSDPVCFYDTGFYIDSESWTWNASEMRSWREKVKRVFRIPSTDHEHDANIEMMLAQASYGGRLVVYFRLDLDSDFEKFINLDDYNGTRFRNIRFTNPAIAIIDTSNGSGDHTYLEGVACSFTLDKDNIVLDKTIKYSYTYEVCGMSSNWCEGTGYELLDFARPQTRTRKSSINAEKQQEERYKKTFADGRCTLGDMDMNRHRDTVYINEFPCGTKCPHCSMFWID